MKKKKIAILSKFNDLKEIMKGNSTKSEELYMKKIRSFRNRYKSFYDKGNFPVRKSAQLHR